MKHRRIRKAALLAVTSITAIVFTLSVLPLASRGAPLWSYCSQDPANLTTNGSMGGGHWTQFGVVADGWEPFNLTGIAPTFEHVDNEEIDPNGSQYIWADDQTFDAGVYEVVGNLTSGSLYKFWLGYALAAIDPKTGQNVRTNHIGRQVGIDSSGGTDPRSSDIAWSPVYYDGIAALNIPELSMTFRAAANKATIFLRAINTDSSGRAKVWFDSACMQSTDVAPTSAPALPVAAETQPAIPPPPVLGTPHFLPLVSHECAPPGVAATLNVGWHPKALAVDPSTNRVYVSLLDASAITFVDVSTLTTLGTWWLQDAGQARGVAAYDATIFAALRDTGSVVLMNGLTGAYKGRGIVGARPYGMDVSNGVIWVANSGAGSVSLLYTTGRVIATQAAGNTPVLVAAEGDSAFVTLLGSGVVRISSGSVVLNRYDTGAGSFGVAFDPLANQLFVSNQTTKQIISLNTSTGEVVGTVALDQPPYALALNRSTGHLYVVLASSNQLDIRDATTLDRVTLLPIGAQGTSGGDGIAVINGRVFVSNNAAGTVSVITDGCQ